MKSSKSKALRQSGEAGLTVFRDKIIKGVDAFKSGPDGPEAWGVSKDTEYRLTARHQGEQLPFLDALEQRHGTDAHTVQYTLVGAPPFRVNKGSLVSLIDVGLELYLTSLFIDLDFPEHEPGNVAEYPELLAFVRSEAARVGLAGLGGYMTNGGARLCGLVQDALLITPETIAEVEARMAGVRQLLKSTELVKRFVIDDTCKDVTRLFRLPFVNRRFHDDGGTEYRERQVHPADFSNMTPIDLAQIEPVYDAKMKKPYQPSLPSVGGVRKTYTSKELGHYREHGVPDALKGRHNALLGLARRQRELGSSEQEVLDFLKAKAPAGKDDDELKGLAKWVAQFPTAEQKLEDARDALKAILDVEPATDVATKKKKVLELLRDEKSIDNLALLHERDRAGLDATVLELKDTRGLGESVDKLTRAIRTQVKQRAERLKRHDHAAGREKAMAGGTELCQKVHDVLADAPVPAGALVPEGWLLTRKGTFKAGLDHPVRVASSPIVIVERQVDLATGCEAVTLAFYRDGRWKTIEAERLQIASKVELLKLSALGLPVSSQNQADLVRYLVAFEDVNLEVLPLARVTTQLGPQGERWKLGFLVGEQHLQPAGGKQVAVHFRAADVGDDQLVKAFHARGTLEGWLEAVKPLRKAPRACLALYASISTALLDILGAANFGIDFCYRTSVGKTSTLRGAASVWGDPNEHAVSTLIQSWDCSRVFAERAPAICNGLPLILDESKRVRDPEQAAQLIYDVINGRGRGRGSMKGLQRTLSWRTTLLSTGESKVTNLTRDAGTRARIISLWGMPFGAADARTRELVNQLNSGVRQHYGHAGPRLVRHLIEHKSDWLEYRRQYEALRGKYYERAGDDEVMGRYAGYLAILEFAGRLLHDVVDLPWKYFDPIGDVWDDVVAGAEEADQAGEALEWFFHWASAHRRQFYHGPGGHYDAGIVGAWNYGDGEDICCFSAVLQKELKGAGFDFQATVDQWADRGWIAVTEDKKKDGRVVRRKTVQVTIPTGRPRMVRIKLKALEARLGPIDNSETLPESNDFEMA